MLTPKRSKLLSFICDYYEHYGYAPNFEEMRLQMGIRSRSSIHAMLSALEKEGYIDRVARRARAIRVREPAQGVHSSAMKAKPLLDREVIADSLHEIHQQRAEASISSVSAAHDVKSDRIIRVPVMGKIAAGTPVDVITDVVDYVDVAISQLSERGSHYALVVDGDSMIGAGIHSGDVAVIVHQIPVNNGDIVVALIDQAEVTLKYLYIDGIDATLVAANPNHPPVHLSADRVAVQGKLHCLIRVYR